MAACEGAASPRAGIFPPRAATSAHRARPASFRPGERTSATEEVVMPDRHSELPTHPDLEYYRKQAKHLQRSYETGDAAAREPAADVAGWILSRPASIPTAGCGPTPRCRA